MKFNHHILILGLTLLALPFSSKGSEYVRYVQDTVQFRIDNLVGNTSIRPEVQTNLNTLDAFAKTISGISDENLVKIEVFAGASPEGGYKRNSTISEERASAIRRYLVQTLKIPQGKIAILDEGTRWDAFKYAMQQSDAYYASQVIDIIDDLALTGYSIDLKREGRVSKLMTLGGGVPYREISRDIFPALRATYINIIHKVEYKEPIKETVVVEAKEVQEPVKVVKEDVVIVNEVIEQKDIEEQGFILMLKNNLLYDAAAVANLGLEFSMGRHMSFCIPVTFSPYTVNPEKWRLRTLSVQPELRFWFTQAGKGHFLGLHGHAAYYNVTTPFDTENRYQDRNGEHPLYGGGLSYGYSFKFGHDSRWGMEFTVGGGYARLDYDTFYNVENGARYKTQVKDYWGITNAGINIYFKIVDGKRRTGK